MSATTSPYGIEFRQRCPGKSTEGDESNHSSAILVDNICGIAFLRDITSLASLSIHPRF